MDSRNNNTSASADYTLQLLLKDNDYLTRYICKRERQNEYSLCFYLIVVFLVITGSIFLMGTKQQFAATNEVCILIFECALFFLLIIGTAVFFHVIRQVCIIYTCKKVLRQIGDALTRRHALFYANSSAFEGITVVTVSYGKPGELTYLIAAVNSLFAALFLTFTFVFFYEPFVLGLKLAIVTVCMNFLSFFLFHCSYIHIRMKVVKSQ
jgi:hypothetical protein